MVLIFKILLLFILYIVISTVVKAAWKIYTTYRKLHDAAKQFQDFGNYNANGQAQGTEGPYSSSNRTYTQTTTPTGDVVEDRRTEDEINRKIFTQDEGEYVDYEEVK